jgi:hypothetical protein
MAILGSVVQGGAAKCRLLLTICPITQQPPCNLYLASLTCHMKQGVTSGVATVDVDETGSLCFTLVTLTQWVALARLVAHSKAIFQQLQVSFINGLKQSLNLGNILFVITRRSGC